ncbi:hypothetical protein Tco_1006304 [Tanacetum coccineum]|uniref:Uncharacterized protein n=1 Tax=Tanacetum coccineum TaxID=301880 RepID=A0ABQ5FHI7_9ASTR
MDQNRAFYWHLLLAIPDEYLLKFHNVADANSLWEAIKSRFGGNEESKKMQKIILKHQFENFSTASNESLDKACDRVCKDEMKSSSSSTSTSQNLAFLSSENTRRIDEDDSLEEVVLDGHWWLKDGLECFDWLRVNDFEVEPVNYALMAISSLRHQIPSYNRFKKLSAENGVIWSKGGQTSLITPVKQNEKRAVHKVSTARPVSNARPVTTVIPFAPKITQTSGAIRPIYPRMDNGNPEICVTVRAVVVSGKGKFKNANLGILDDVYFVMITFKLLDESQVVLRAPRKDNVYNLDLKNIVPL